MGKRFKGPVRQLHIVEDSSEEDENQVEEAKITHARGVNDQASEDDDYFDE